MAKTAATPPITAQETMAYCTSCKMDLNHRVVAMKGDRIAKTQCLTCKKEHVYKAPKGITEPPVKKPKKSKKDSGAQPDSATSIETEWQKLMATHKDAPTKSYNTKGQFTLGDKLKHPVFGEGIVGRLIYPNKLEVIFQTQIKVLIYGGLQQ
jgi:hypothetical protein